MSAPRALSVEQVREAGRLCRAGWTLREVAEWYGVVVSTVHQLLTLSGTRMRCPGVQGRFWRG